MLSDYQALSERLKLLAHPERLRILDIVRREAECVCHLEALLDKPQPYVSQQLRFLRNAGLITDERRGHNIYYALDNPEIEQWLALILGPAEEDLLLAHLKKTIPCQCPSCDANVQVAFAPHYPPQELEMSKAKMIFLCTGNSARSQMAEALMKKYAGHQYEVYSAGLEPKGINPYTIRVMNEIGIDVSGNQSTNLRDYLGHVNFGYLFTVCAHAEANCPTAFLNTGGQRIHWYFDDPAAVEGTDEAKLTKFREIRNEIDAKIQNWLAEQE